MDVSSYTANRIAQVDIARLSTVCNGYSELCPRQFSDVSFLTTHNSYASQSGLIASNQDYPVTKQLDDGIRAFMFDLHTASTTLNVSSLIGNSKRQNSPAQIELCHTSCYLLDAGSFVDQLVNIKTFINAQPKNVITIFLENFDRFSSADIQSNFVAANLADNLFNPNDYSHNGFKWPTLQEMIDTKKNVVVFSDTISDQTTYPQIMLQSTYVAQTSFEVKSGAPFTCSLMQSPTGLTLMNHFVYVDQNILNSTFQVPDSSASSTANALASITSQSKLCLNSNPPLFPNFVALDFYNMGDGFEAVASINNVSLTNVGTNVFPNSTSQSTSKTSSSIKFSPVYTATFLSSFLLFLILFCNI
ncbi:hypothetical protein BB560_002275 [Smittium megazygosporum]|uniref:Phosphatidylinositol-specific phospholipase C X domain-containing protein n=1 Tax=Smittium megazygosporum TaxID=133381 RepID=A0A2T9ZFC5_9FUNG|nr:hypothetical protein BB560_002275 [Smittium megazygosporum]